jgi:hypothetical protein
MNKAIHHSIYVKGQEEGDKQLDGTQQGGLRTDESIFPE